MAKKMTFNNAAQASIKEVLRQNLPFPRYLKQTTSQAHRDFIWPLMDHHHGENVRENVITTVTTLFGEWWNAEYKIIIEYTFKYTASIDWDDVIEELPAKTRSVSLQVRTKEGIKKGKWQTQTKFPDKETDVFAFS